MKNVIMVDDNSFDSVITNSTVPVLVDFWAEWCGPCRMLGPIIEQVSEEIGEKAKICKLNVDESPAIAHRYGIMSIPTLLIFKGGKIVDKMVGVTPKQNIISKLNAV